MCVTWTRNDTDRSTRTNRFYCSCRSVFFSPNAKLTRNSRAGVCVTQCERSEHHTNDSAWIVECSFLLDSRSHQFLATALTRVRYKATGIWFEYTKNLKRNQSSTKPTADWAPFIYWNRATETPNHVRHLMRQCSIEQATLFDEDGIERNLLAIVHAQNYNWSSSQNTWIAPAKLKRNLKSQCSLLL